MRVVLLLLAALLAGCADDGASEPEEPEAFQEIEQTDKDKGVIRGVVVNQNIEPVEGATVTLVGQDLSEQTDEDGAFVFTDLEPGTYFMEVSAAAHNTVQSSADVVAGVAKPKAVQVRLIFTPPPVPYVEEIPWRFWMDASANVGGNRVVLGNVLGEGTFGATLDYETNVTWVQSELSWSYQQPLAEIMRLQTNVQHAEGNIASGAAQGPSPIHVAFGDDEDVSNAVKSGYTLYVGPGTTAPVGVTAGQELQLFLHVFHHFAPPSGWTFSSDGAVSPP